MKTRRLNPGIIVILIIVVSFFCGLSLPTLPGFFPEAHPFETTLWESIVSLILLLGLCLLSARVILWAYSRVELPQHPRRIFIYGLIISAIGVLISMGLRFMQGQYVLDMIKNQLPDLPLSTGYINFFSEGLGPVLFTCAITTLTLLWIARWKKINNGSEALFGIENKKQDIILILSTLVIYAFSIKMMLEFIRTTVFFLGLR